MSMAGFGYTRPATLDEALADLAKHGPDAKLIAGGHSLLPLMKMRLASVGHLVDIGRLRELKGIRDWNGGLAIGAATTYREVLGSALVRDRFPLLIEGLDDIGDIQVRNRGTLGGSLAHADPASDMPALALALDAELLLRSSGGERTVKVDGFFHGAFVSDLHPDEVMVEIRIPASPDGAGTSYVELTQPASGYSLVGVAVVLAKSGGTVSHVRVGVTGVADHAYRASAVESTLMGSDGGSAAIAAAAAHAADGQEVNSDIHADREYRTAMATAFTRRSVESAAARAT